MIVAFRRPIVWHNGMCMYRLLKLDVIKDSRAYC